MEQAPKEGPRDETFETCHAANEVDKRISEKEDSHASSGLQVMNAASPCDEPFREFPLDAERVDHCSAVDTASGAACPVFDMAAEDEDARDCEDVETGRSHGCWNIFMTCLLVGLLIAGIVWLHAKGIVTMEMWNDGASNAVAIFLATLTSFQHSVVDGSENKGLSDTTILNSEPSLEYVFAICCGLVSVVYLLRYLCSWTARSQRCSKLPETNKQKRSWLARAPAVICFISMVGLPPICIYGLDHTIVASAPLANDLSKMSLTLINTTMETIGDIAADAAHAMQSAVALFDMDAHLQYLSGKWIAVISIAKSAASDAFAHPTGIIFVTCLLGLIPGALVLKLFRHFSLRPDDSKHDGTMAHGAGVQGCLDTRESFDGDLPPLKSQDLAGMVVKSPVGAAVVMGLSQRMMAAVGKRDDKNMFATECFNI
jgi:hypothetical protein